MLGARCVCVRGCQCGGVQKRPESLHQTLRDLLPRESVRGVNGAALPPPGAVERLTKGVASPYIGFAFVKTRFN